ncbi:MAG TPA: hypothetical protein VK789_29265 [Bryobacteraceae bacterium]|jgi:hypothetical protein|nr:hypothetical protein [Bryobacteraceae bacterium]
MFLRTTFGLIAAASLSLAQRAPIPGDPLELATGQIHAIEAHPDRTATFQLLSRARDNYGLRNADRAYDLKVTFTVDSGGQTEHDGIWEMEDIFDPGQGLHWTATSSDGYQITGVTASGKYYGASTGSYIPLRLQEARAALFDPIPSAANVARAPVRTSLATFNGTPLTCILLAGSKNTPAASPARRWDETEECVDPKSGMLMVHSQAPGRYYAYDYTNAPQLGGYLLPRKVTVTEAGRIVSEISVDSLTQPPAVDPSLFVPTDAMKAMGPPVAMGGAEKIFRSSGSAAATRTVCIFGVVTPSGQIVEAHSLQPSDPNSQSALADAKQLTFPHVTMPGSRPRQHFIFVFETFPSPQ